MREDSWDIWTAVHGLPSIFASPYLWWAGYSYTGFPFPERWGKQKNGFRPTGSLIHLAEFNRIRRRIIETKATLMVPLLDIFPNPYPSTRRLSQASLFRVMAYITEFIHHRVPGFLSSRPNWVPPTPHPQESVAMSILRQASPFHT